MKRFYLQASIVMFVVSSAGCGNMFNQHAQLMDTMRGAVQEASARLASSGTGQVQAGGQVIDPGIEVSAGVRYFAEARYKGVAGQVQAAQMGELGREVSPEVQERINRVYSNTALSASEKFTAALAILRETLEKDGKNTAASETPAAATNE